MDIESFRRYCLNLPFTEEALPFGPDTLVLKVMGKAFALAGLDNEDFRVNLKCDPEKAIELRDAYPGQIIPGWHMNKQHWNTVYFEQGLTDPFLTGLIKDSYDLVVMTLPLKVRQSMEKENGK